MPNFAEAIRRALRQDPDVILVGEMRDLETIEAAISAAETGHLVFGTLHTNGAAKTIDRIVDAFPTNMKDMIRTQLSTFIQAVISQVLCEWKSPGASPATRSWSTPPRSPRSSARTRPSASIPTSRPAPASEIFLRTICSIVPANSWP